MGCPAQCACTMVQGSGRYHLESVGLRFVREALPFPEGSCFALVRFSVPVTACIAEAAVAELYSLYIVKINE